jgi:predicted nucleotidyltransferase
LNLFQRTEAGLNERFNLEVSPDTINLIIAILQKNGKVGAAYILGSAASGEMRTDSDVDIAILPAEGQKISSLELADITAELSFESRYTIDTGLITSANLVYSKEAITKGKRIFVRNAKWAGIMTASLIGMYMAFNDQRQELLNAYRT